MPREQPKVVSEGLYFKHKNAVQGPELSAELLYFSPQLHFCPVVVMMDQ